MTPHHVLLILSGFTLLLVCALYMIVRYPRFAAFLERLLDA